MATTIQSLQRLIAGGLSLRAQQAVDQVIRHPHPRMVSYEDQAILNKLPVTTAATYRYADQWDAMMTLSRLRTSGSIVESVCLEVAAEELRDRRAGR